MRIVSVEEMQRLDRQASEQYHIPGSRLMEAAGESLAVWARLFLPRDSRSRVIVLAGGGKNGGDGLVCARRLAAEDVEVEVLFLGGAKPAPETQAQLRKAKQQKLAVKSSPQVFPGAWVERLLSADLVVDALLGIGLAGSPREPMTGAINALNTSGVKVLSADAPSGLNADTGEPMHPTVRADLTVTFGLPKRGLLQPAAANFVGRLEVEPIGFPEALLSGRDDAFTYLDPLEAAGLLPRRPMTAHKRSAGKVLVIGGSHHYHGAPILAAAGAVRAGAGYVVVAYPRPLDTVMRTHLVEELCLPLAGTAPGILGRAGFNAALMQAADSDAVVVGPGLGQSQETLAALKAFLLKVTGPKTVVVDADGLLALMDMRLGNGSRRRPVFILTPHEGEAGRLLRRPAEAVAADRWGAAQELARRYAAVVVLKGRNTVVTTAGGPLRVVGAGTPALATAGTGDVLAGAIAALAAQKVAPPDAAALAATLQGLAGELAGPDPGGLGQRARDVADNLPLAIRHLRLRSRRPGAPV